MTEHIHTCNYECTKPACVLSQRDEFVNRLEQRLNAVADIRCASCGYMTYHREHLHCVSAGKTREISFGFRDLVRDQETKQPVIAPVAWMHITDEGHIRMWSKASPESIEAAIGVKPIPLYTRPQPAATKEWVGLTDNEIKNLQTTGSIREEGFQDGALWAAEKLKERNA